MIGKIFSSGKFFDLKQTLLKLDKPYGLDFKKFFFIKYVLSVLFFIVIFFRTKNVIFSIIYFVIIYFIPDFLVSKFQKNEAIVLVNEIRNISSNLILLLTSNVNFYEALKSSKSSIEYNRLKKHFDIFVEDYSLYNFNLSPALEKFKNNFTSDEFNMFAGILYQGEKEGKIVEMLTVFQSTLELSYFKYLKYRKRKVASYILIASIVSLINIILISMYPMIIQIMENIQIIFN